MICPILFMQDRARELANIVGGEALSLAELNSFHPEDGMILANTTSIGMQPRIDETPISKVCLFIILFSYIKLLAIVCVRPLILFFFSLCNY